MAFKAEKKDIRRIGVHVGGQENEKLYDWNVWKIR